MFKPFQIRSAVDSLVKFYAKSVGLISYWNQRGLDFLLESRDLYQAEMQRDYQYVQR